MPRRCHECELRLTSAAWARAQKDTSGGDCQNIVGTSAYDLYKLDDGPASLFTSPSSHVLVQEQKDCNGDGETDHGYYLTLQQCADACAATTGCVNFIYARIGAGRCSGTNCKCFTVRATAPLPPPPHSFSHIPPEP